ncbi:CDP-glycerol glycerophosphotransferase family protein [Lactiplantibacillus plantarum]|uniref:CDP-glycerol glycerophosphotransferase family protein n=1 Tax=Lactiplantibacillus plantarum TaxID=1590 RepID=UPI0013D438C4|nr:CDP-glycerol glycerophosphotransferase family protein [Lactiplantibacillus plantarum]
MVIIRTILYFFSSFFPRSPRILVFGAWFGKRFSDNPRYLLDEMLKSEHFRNNQFIWIGNRDTFPTNYDVRVQFVVRNSWKSFWYQLRAYKAFVSHGFQDLGSVSLLKGAITYQLWHGFPVKHIGADDPGNANEGQHTYEHYQFFLANSKIMADRIYTAFKNYGATRNNTIVAPQPRDDYLQHNVNNANLKNKIRQKLGVSRTAIIISYLPTFRDNSEQVFYFTENSSPRLRAYLRANHMVILERQHFARNNQLTAVTNKQDSDLFINLTEQVEVQDVLLVTDYLISDYSSVYVDFLHLKKPIIHFLYDGDNYFKNDRGLYVADPKTEFGGPIAYSLDDLITLLKEPPEKLHQFGERLSTKLSLASSPTLITILESKG